ncbi:hypothetical protein, partial [Chromatium okenii]|uniref:hypothetical protein n=1 Tax=Chromatium okenii TaxID=61644 RepID=UPI0026EEF58F
MTQIYNTTTYKKSRNPVSTQSVTAQFSPSLSDLSAALSYIDSSDRETRLKVATALTTEFGKSSAQSYWCDWCGLKKADFLNLAPQAGR